MLEYNVDQLMRRLAYERGEDMTTRAAARGIGISRQTLHDLTGNRRPQQVQTLEKLLKFFRENGMTDITVSDLFREVPDADAEPGPDASTDSSA